MTHGLHGPVLEDASARCLIVLSAPLGFPPAGVAAADDQEPVPGQPAAEGGSDAAPSLIMWRDAIISTVLEIIFLVNGERKTVPSDKMSITTDITMRTRGTFARLIRQSLSSD